MTKTTPTGRLTELPAFLKQSALWCALLLAISPALADDEIGIPWTGQTGVTETVTNIMARNKQLPLQSSLQPAQSDEGRLLPNRKNLGQNSFSPNSSRYPVSAAAPVEASAFITPQSIGTSFLGAQLSESGFIPPDSMGAVGPSQVLVCVNGRIKVFDKNGAVGALDATTKTFFGSLGINSPSDPRVRYDRLSGRWFVVMIDVPHSKKDNKILIAVSSGALITDSSSFTFFSFVHSVPSGGGDGGDFADYPTLGIDRNALYIGANIFSGTSYAGTSAYVVRKSDLLSGTLTVTAFRQLASSSGPGPYTPQGVDNDDPAATQGFLIGVDNISEGLLVLRRISNPGGVPTLSGNINLTVPNTVGPIGAVPAQSSSIGLDALDERLFVARMHKGSLWTAHNLQVNASGTADSAGDRKGSRWYEITNVSTTPTLRQSGTLFDSTPSNPANYWIPSCMVNGQGHMVLGCSVAGVNEFAEIAVAARYASDPLGTLQAPTVVQTSSTAYNLNDGVNPHRWGDFSLTSVDPNDDMTFWTVQEYCNAANSWGVRVLQIKAPPPATPLACNPPSLPAGAVNSSVVVTGFSTNGSGFFDPGAGFTNHLYAVFAGPWITVHSVLSTDPTHLTLNVSVSAGAPSGARILTVTNPDGQSASSASGILTIIGGVVSNQPPSISGIPNATINEDTALTGISFQVNDLETAPGNLVLSATSSDTNLFPVANILFAGSGTNRTLTLLPATNQNGSAIITLTVADTNAAVASTSFLLTVNPVNDPPEFSKGPNQSVLENAGPQVASNWATSLRPGPADEASQLLNFTVSNDNNALFAAQPAIASTGTLSYTPALNASGTATISVQLHDSGGTANSGVDTSPAQTFTITILPANQRPVLAAMADQMVHLGATITLTNHATDPDPDLLSYSLSNAPAGAVIGSTSGIFSWHPAPLDVNTTNLIAITVTDNGSPPLSDTKAFTAIVLPPPLISSINISNELVNLNWSAISGATYRVQFIPDLGATSVWQNLPGSITAGSASATTVDTNILSTGRFYRVVQP